MGKIVSGLPIFDTLDENVEMYIEPSHDNSNHETEIIKSMYRAKYDYMMHENRNVEKIGEMLDDGFTLTHMTGMVQHKEEYLTCIADGRLSYFNHQHENIEVQLIDENHAVLTGQTRVAAEVFGGSRHTWPLQLKFDMENKDGQWLMMRAVASTY